MALLGGQFKSATHGQFKSAQGGHFDRILQLKTSRDCFATTHKRAGTTKDVIGEMMGHSDDYISTPHYLADLDTDKIWDANDCLF